MSDDCFETCGYAAEYLADIARAELLCFPQPWSEKAIEEFCSYACNGVVIVMKNGVFAGYTGYTCVADELQVANVAVLPAFRRQGAALRMLAELKDIAVGKGCRTITLEVRESNVPAIRLYERLGFITVGRRRGYYKAPTEDAVLMDLELR